MLCVPLRNNNQLFNCGSNLVSKLCYFFLSQKKVNANEVLGSFGSRTVSKLMPKVDAQKINKEKQIEDAVQCNTV